MEALKVQEPKVGRKWPRFVGKLWVRTQMGEKGRLAIPAALREAMGMADGDVLDMRVVDGELRIATMRERLRRAQERVKALVPPGISLAGELSAERREAAKHE
jgi:AbrB family looped-hinge helix DNA binding protein